MRVRRACVGVAAVLAAALTLAAAVAESAVQVRSGATWTTAVPAVALATVAFSWFAVGAYLTLVRPRNALGPLLASVGLVTQTGVAGEVVGRAGGTPWTSSALGLTVDLVAGLGLYLLVGLLPLWYPDRRLDGRAPKILAASCALGAVLLQGQWLHAQLDARYTWAFGPAAGPEQGAWVLWTPVALYAAGVVGAWALCVVRLVHAGYPERQQLAWLLVSVVVLLLTMLLGESPAATAVQAVALLGLPVAIGVGVVRYRLLDIRTALPRVITAATLALVIAGSYAGATALAGARSAGTGVPVVVVAVVAAALLPVHDRLRRLVDRLVYGTRADPVRAVTDLRTAMADVGDGELLEAALTQVTTAFRAPGAVVRDAAGDVVARVGSWDDDAGTTAELTVAGGTVGSLTLGPRRQGERYSRADVAMLTAMAGPVALVVRAVDLAAELETQRDAVVGASAAARSRLSRDLHDGLGPSLTGLRLGLQALEDAQAEGDAERARDITRVLREETDRSVGEVRRIIDDLRPLDLETADLAAALRRRLAGSGAPVPVTLRTDPLPPLPQQVEDAVYRVVTEAVANAHRHASARAVDVRLRVEDAHLVATVADDGCGLPDDARPGVGLRSMRARATELGGALTIDAGAAGTTVMLTVPLPAVDVPQLAGTGS